MRYKFFITLFALGVLLPLGTSAALPDPADVLVKASGPAVYYYANDGQRYVFPNEGVYFSWFFDFSNIINITDEELASIPIGGNVTYRPGIKMLKIKSDPKVYAVDVGGVLRWITSEELAASFYGVNWNQYVRDVSDALFINYTVGEPINSIDDYKPSTAAAAAHTINANKSLSVGLSPRESNTAAPHTMTDLETGEPGNALTATQEELNTTYRQFALGHLNELRASVGKAALILNDQLNDIALAHSQDMGINLKAMSHDGSLGDTASDRIKLGKVPDTNNPGSFINLPTPDGIGWSGENIGLRDTHFFTSFEAAIRNQHEWFLDEPDDEYNHRTTMLSTLAPFSEVGIGFYLDDIGRLWITEDFISLQ